MDVVEFYRVAAAEFDRRVQAVGSDQWEAATPCTEWDVRTLVNHIVNEDRWVAPLLEGKTIEEVGDSLDGDLLGDDPRAAWEAARSEGVSAAAAADLDGTVQVSFGEIPVTEYLSQVATDHVIHAWDLARGIGADEELAIPVVDAAYAYLAPQIEAWRQAGAFGPPAPVPPGATRQVELLALTGRSSE